MAPAEVESGMQKSKQEEVLRLEPASFISTIRELELPKR